MSVAVMVMNPRRIEECVASFETLETDVIWLTGYTQTDLADVIPGVIADTTYDAYALCADDCIVSQAAVDAVFGLLEHHPVATGYCRLDMTSPLVNITRTPLVGNRPEVRAYGEWWTYEDAREHPTEVLETHFMGNALTALPRELWERFPYAVHRPPRHGCASDFALSARLRDAGIPMVAAREGYVEHVKETWNAADREPRKRVLVGKVPAEVTIQAGVRA